MHRPSSVASFLFSLANNKEAEQMNADLIDFSKRLRMNEKGFKIVFLLFLYWNYLSHWTNPKAKRFTNASSY